MDENLRVEVEEAWQSLPAHAHDCVVAILLETPNGLVLHGTGTLFRMANHFFVVTASHVIVADEPTAAEKVLFLVCPAGTAPIPLRGTRVVTHSPGGWEFDQADVAIWELSKPTLKLLGRCVFLCQADIVADDDFEDDYYFVVGFPSSWARITDDHTRGLELLTYCTQLHDGTCSSGKYRADWHLLLSRAGGESRTGGRAEMPASIRGMSGGSVWRSYFTRDGARGGARVVAVQTSSLRNETILKSTRWAAIAHMIIGSYPDLRAPSALGLPPRNS